MMAFSMDILFMSDSAMGEILVDHSVTISRIRSRHFPFRIGILPFRN